jgi:hypothetical protein
MIRSRWAEHGGLWLCFPWCARPTEGSHGLTTPDPAQRGEGAKRRPGPRRTPALWPPMRLPVGFPTG